MDPKIIPIIDVTHRENFAASSGSSGQEGCCPTFNQSSPEKFNSENVALSIASSIDLSGFSLPASDAPKSTI